MKYLKTLIQRINEKQYKVLVENSEILSDTQINLISFYKNEIEPISNDKLSEKLSLKPSTLKKIQSNLITEILNILAGEDIISKINFLATISFHKLLTHIARKEIKKLEKNGNTSLLKKLYYELPSRYLNADVYSYEMKDLETYKEKFFQLSNDDTKKEFLKLVFITLKLEHSKKLKENEKTELLDTISKIKTFDNLDLKIRKNTVLHAYYERFDSKKQGEYIKANYLLCKENGDKLSEKTIVNNKLHYSLFLVNSNEFNVAHQLLKEIFKEHEALVSIHLRFVDLFYQLCIGLEKYDEAIDLIQKYHKINPNKLNEIAEENFDIINNLAMIDILRNNYDNAFEKLQFAKNGLKKQYFIVFDCLVRIVEQAYFFSTQDYDFAESLYQKNVKFYSYHQESGFYYLKQAHTILNFYSSAIFNKKKLSPKLQKALKQLKSGESAFIGHFIEKLNPNP